ncbi:MAG: hypothetical protein IRY98_01305, partial [Alicyclobacillaceae bacterium]|nr:hypothetical protein [Alicyclobacillaceae bacterium]
MHAPLDFFRYVARPEDRGKSLEDVLRDAGLSRRHIRRLVRSKKIRVNGKLSFLAKPIKPGDVIEADLREPTRALRVTAPLMTRPPLDIPILYEDPWVLVVNKPAGV